MSGIERDKRGPAAPSGHHRGMRRQSDRGVHARSATHLRTHVDIDLENRAFQARRCAVRCEIDYRKIAFFISHNYDVNVPGETSWIIRVPGFVKCVMGFPQQRFWLASGRQGLQPKGEISLQICCRCRASDLWAPGVVVALVGKIAQPSPARR